MEANNSQSNDGDFFEYIGGVGAKEPGKKKRKRQSNQGPVDTENSNLSENNFDIRAELNKIHEKLNNQSEEMGTMKSEKQLLAAKLDLLQAQNGELLARLETMERKLKVAELETKMAKQEMHNSVAEKVNEETGQLREKLRKTKRKMQEDRLKFNELEAKLERKVNKLDAGLKMMAKQLVQGMADLRGKAAALECQAAIGKRKLEETRESVKELSKYLWSINRWNTSVDPGHLRLNGDGLVVTAENVDWASVRAQQPVSRQMLASIPGLPMFFTMKCLQQILRKPIALASANLVFYPAVGFHWKGSSVEINFGADPAKPIKFQINAAHMAQLFE